MFFIQGPSVPVQMLENSTSNYLVTHSGNQQSAEQFQLAYSWEGLCLCFFYIHCLSVQDQ